ncbi:hypothetical protein SFUMM280S_02144 [Streptomyces fumanus]
MARHWSSLTPSTTNWAKPPWSSGTPRAAYWASSSSLAEATIVFRTSRTVQVRAGDGRVVAVGTTAVRAVESAADRDGVVRARRGWTDLVVTRSAGCGWWTGC